MESTKIARHSMQHWHKHTLRLQLGSQASKSSPVAANSTYLIMNLGSNTYHGPHNRLLWLIYHRHHWAFHWQHRLWLSKWLPVRAWISNINLFPFVGNTDVINLVQPGRKNDSRSVCLWQQGSVIYHCQEVQGTSKYFQRVSCSETSFLLGRCIVTSNCLWVTRHFWDFLHKHI